MMTTSPFKLRDTSFGEGVETRRPRRSATAPAKSVRFATSPPLEKPCPASKEPPKPDLSSLGPVINRINKEVKSESAKTVSEETARDDKLKTNSSDSRKTQMKSNERKPLERPKTAPMKRSLSPPLEVKDIEVQCPSTSSQMQEPLTITTPMRLMPALKLHSAPPKSRAKNLCFRVGGNDSKKTITGGKSGASTASSPYQLMNHTRLVREQTNAGTHIHIRMMRHDVAILRSKMIKLEEEIRLASKSRSLLESGLYDIRKSMSVNHQAISTHQRRKKSSEESLLKALAEESQVLSTSKRTMEQQLATLKATQQNLEKTRKDMEEKMSILGRALSLDAQNFKVFNGPISTKGLLISRQRHFSTSSKPPNNTPVDQEMAQFLSNVSELMKVSKKVRGDLLAAIVSMKSTRSNIHGKVNDAMTTAAKEATGHRQQMELQRGKVRVEKYAASRQKHSEEIGLGLSLGPHSESLRQTAERVDRPLSRIRPEVIPLEAKEMKETSHAASRQLSATSARDSKLGQSDQKLKKKIRDKSGKAGSLSKSLRLRKASLDHKWVES